MYEQHFGLKKNPFLAKARGNAVFVGPQTAKTMAGLKKALTSQDAVLTVSGLAGSGKTTVVVKALDALSNTHTYFRIGRMRLAGTDALEFLLEELGVEEIPRGAIRQFAALRERLNQLEAEGTRVVIAIEDAAHIGAETLAELEALTAADAGDSGGAAMVLMGDDGLADFCKDPQLKRLEQRIRQHFPVAPLNAAELRGYLMHCFRRVGGHFEHIFDDQTASLVHKLSEGIPRIANRIVESALSAAAVSGIEKVTSGYLIDILKNELGLQTKDADTAPVASPDAEPVSEPEPEPVAVAEEPEPEPETEPEPEVVAEEPEPESEAAPEVEPELEAEFEVPEEPEPCVEPPPLPDPVIVFSDEAMHEPPPVDEDIPELIQDTLPDLKVLAPEIVALEPTAESEPAIPEVQPEPEPTIDQQDIPELQPLPEPEPVPVLEVAPEPEPEPEPEPVLEFAPEPEPVADNEEESVPDWDRDPTLAELKPDLDALEKAMAFAHGDTEDDAPALAAEVAQTPEANDVDASSDEIPEITLDEAIQTGIQDNLIDEPGQISPTLTEETSFSSKDESVPKVRIAPQKSRKADAEIERIAAELAKAKTIEDVDDKLAETLFGEEINLIASQVIAAGANAESANDEELGLFDTAAASMAQATGSTVPESVVAEKTALEVSLETREHGGEAGIDLSASQRLKTVRALNADLHPSLREPEGTREPANSASPPTAEATPDPIEDQIDTSLTATLKALKLSQPPPDSDPDDDAGETKTGFFSRFKRS